MAFVVGGADLREGVGGSAESGRAPGTAPVVLALTCWDFPDAVPKFRPSRKRGGVSSSLPPAVSLDAVRTTSFPGTPPAELPEGLLGDTAPVASSLVTVFPDPLPPSADTALCGPATDAPETSPASRAEASSAALRRLAATILASTLSLYCTMSNLRFFRESCREVSPLVLSPSLRRLFLPVV